MSHAYSRAPRRPPLAYIRSRHPLRAALARSIQWLLGRDVRPRRRARGR